jgi:hypothetical protein
VGWILTQYFERYQIRKELFFLYLVI